MHPTGIFAFAVASAAVAGLLSATAAIAQTETGANALTLYSTARPGAVSPELYRDGGRGQAVPGYAMVRHERDLALNRGRNTVRFRNAQENNMGMPLPAGRIRVSKLDDADQTLEFIGAKPYSLYLASYFPLPSPHASRENDMPLV